MKKISLLIGLLIGLGLTLKAQTGIDLDNESGTSMKPVVGEMQDIIDTFEQDSLEIVHIEFDLIFADRTREVFRTLYSGYTYGVFVYGDYRIKQLGVNLYKKDGDNWIWVKSGKVDSNSNTTSVLLEIDETNQYKVELISNEMEEGYTAGHYAMYLFHN
jgi:hypothetical protein